jgi:sulfotransferase
MNKTYYFMSGLPRSGSSLLSAILNQNPRFYCGPSSPVPSIILDIENNLKKNELHHAYVKDNFQHDLIKSVLTTYYAHDDFPVIIDKNRSWTHRLDYLNKYFDIEKPKVICTVRDLSEILASFITMIHRSKQINFIDRQLEKQRIHVSDFTRCQIIASDGPLGRGYTGLQKAFESGFGKYIHLVEYNDLVKDPENTLKRIYNFLGEEYYSHSFDNVKNVHREDDGAIYGLPDMHSVRSEIKSTAKPPEDVLPAQVIKDVSGLEFWREL